MAADEEAPVDGQPSRLFRRWLLRRALPALAVLALAIAALHLRDRSQDRELAERAAQGGLLLQSKLLERELEVVAATAVYLGEQPSVDEFVAGRGERDVVEADFLAFSRNSRSFDQLRILDETGMEVVRVNFEGGAPVSVPAERLQSKADRYYFRIAADLAPREVYVSPFDLNVEYGRIEEPWKPVIRFSTPVVAEGRRAVVVLNYLGRSLLERLQQAAQPLGGWSAVVNEEGYFLEGRTRADSWGFMFDAPPTFARAHPAAWAAMRTNPEGVLQTGAGMFVWRSFGAEGGGPPGRDDLRLDLVTFRAAEHLYADSARALRLMLVLGAFVALVLGLTTFHLARAADLRAAHEARIEASELRLRQLSTRLLEAQEAERRSLSRDLHDELGQIATAVTIDLKQAQRKPEEHAALLDRALAGTAQMLESLHALSSRLRTSLLDDLGLRHALLEHGQEVEQRSGIDIDVQVDVDETRVPPTVGIHVYRIVQEALNNVLRHAGASTASVRVSSDDAGVEVEVRDDGVGFDLAESPPQRLGLVGMRERVELLSGRLEIRSRPNHGTVVRAWIPIAGEESTP